MKQDQPAAAPPTVEAPMSSSGVSVPVESVEGITVAGARAFWALKDLEARHEALRVAVMVQVSDPHLDWPTARKALTDALNAEAAPTAKSWANSAVATVVYDIEPAKATLPPVESEHYLDCNCKACQKWKRKQHAKAALPPVEADTMPTIEQRYHELLYQVATKFPGESRHDTAKRYIREREDARGLYALGFVIGLIRDADSNGR